jgi:hypothetical protein
VNRREARKARKGQGVKKHLSLTENTGITEAGRSAHYSSTPPLPPFIFFVLSWFGFFILGTLDEVPELVEGAF